MGAGGGRGSCKRSCSSRFSPLSRAGRGSVSTSLASCVPQTARVLSTWTAVRERTLGSYGRNRREPARGTKSEHRPAGYGARDRRRGGHPGTARAVAPAHGFGGGVYRFRGGRQAAAAGQATARAV